MSDKKKFIDIADDFLEFISGKKIVIHNAEFDISHLNNELSLINKKSISKDNVIDTLEIARNKYPGSGLSLDALCKRFKIDNSKREKHTALIDCDLLSKVYINLLGQKEPVFQFKNSKKNNNLRDESFKNYSKIIIKPSEKEIIEHKKFINKELKKNFY